MFTDAEPRKPEDVLKLEKVNIITVGAYRCPRGKGASIVCRTALDAGCQ